HQVLFDHDSTDGRSGMTPHAAGEAEDTKRNLGMTRPSVTATSISEECRRSRIRQSRAAQRGMADNAPQPAKTSQGFTATALH
ncbi:hypothetical protein, partial [Enterococcus faecium]|uniref:hypothetical protein n=1 Tax=Enterococcus faecium TaxID=1352 RepID=UPI001C9CBEA9